MKRWTWTALVVALAAVTLIAADGPLTPLSRLKVRTDANGYLLTTTGAYSGSDGPLTTGANIKVRTDANGYLITTLNGPLFTATPSITAGSGTGITVNNTGEVRTLVYKVTVAASAFVCAAVTCDVTLGTLPAKTFLNHALADLTQVFACTATCTSSTLSATVGKTAGGNQYLLSFDTDAATAQFGDAAAELGASLAPATVATEAGDLSSWSATTAVVLRMTSGTGNIGTGAATNFSQGSVTIYLYTTVYP